MKKAADPHPLCFSELVENQGLIFLRVRKMAKWLWRHVEKKGVRGSRSARFGEVSEVAVNKRLRGILGWAGERCDAGRRTGGVAITTNTFWHLSSELSRTIIDEMVAVRTGC
jgi:hypothetical protein